jgi:hypothetical protein
MKKIGALLLALVAPASMAQELYAEFSITSPLTVDAYTRLRLEVDTTGAFYGANGVFEKASGSGYPVSGTCVRSGSGIFCALQSGFLSYGLELDQSLNGRVTAQDGEGVQTDSSPVTLLVRRVVP